MLSVGGEGGYREGDGDLGGEGEDGQRALLDHLEKHGERVRHFIEVDHFIEPSSGFKAQNNSSRHFWTLYTLPFFIISESDQKIRFHCH